MQSQIFWRKKSGRPLGPHPEMDHRTEEQGPHTCITLAETSQECGPICLCWIYSPAILPTTVLWAIKASCSSNSLFCLFFMYYSLKSYLQSVLQLGRNTWSTSFFSNPTYSIIFHPLQGLYMCSVQSLSCVWLFVTPWTAAQQASLSITNSWSLLKLMSIDSVMPSSDILCRSLLLPSIFPSIRVFSNESALHIWWPEYWSFSFSISPSNEYSGLISFRIDWFDLLAVQGTLKSLLQHHSSKASILECSAFFIVQLSHPYMTTGKNHSFD